MVFVLPRCYFVVDFSLTVQAFQTENAFRLVLKISEQVVVYSCGTMMQTEKCQKQTEQVRLQRWIPDFNR